MIKGMTCMAIVLGIGMAIAGPVRADETTPASAKTLLAEGRQKAVKQKKNVLVMFHATW